MRTTEGNEMTSTDAKHEARCLRPGCGRKLTSAKSVAAGYGPVCLRKIRAAAIAEARQGYSDAQQAAADQLIRDGGLVPHPHRDVFTAVSSDGTATYKVHPAGVCNCVAGLKGRRCYHVLAARIVHITRNRAALAA